MSTITTRRLPQLDWQERFFVSLKSSNKFFTPVGVPESPILPFPLPEDTSIEDFNPHVFSEALTGYNQRVLLVMQKILAQELPELAGQPHICIATTGSDGREEKMRAAASPFDLIVLVDEKANVQSTLIAKIQKFITDHPILFCQEWELKCLDSDNLLCYSEEKDPSKPQKVRPFPTIGLDALHLAGNPSVFEDYKSRYFKTLYTPGSGHLIRDFYKHNIKQHLHGLDRILQNQSTDLSLETGLVNYDGERVKATKFPLLRVVQYTLAYKIFKWVNTGKLSWEDFSQLPKNTVDRMQWLASKNLLKIPPGELQNLQQSYIASLIWLEQSQRLYGREGQIQTRAEPELLRRTVTCISHFRNTILEKE